MAPSVDNPWVLSVFDELLVLTDDIRRHDFPIYRVPSIIRMLKPDQYDFHVLPLGLYNRDLKNVTPMDRLKLEMLSIFLKHMKLLDPNGWSTFRAKVAEPPSDATDLEDFYHDPPRDTFITPEGVKSLLTVDAVFVAAFYYPVFVDLGREFGRDHSALGGELQEIFSRGTVRCILWHLLSDIWLVENQIPLFLVKNVLREISPLTPDFQFDIFLRRIVFDFARTFRLPYAQSREHDISFKSCDHLLACVHKAVCVDPDGNPSSGAGCFEANDGSNIKRLIRSIAAMLRHVPILWQRLESDKRQSSTINMTPCRRTKRTLPTVTQLRRAGIGFRGIRTSVGDIRFVKSFFNLTATLYLPEIGFHDYLQICLLNMCAYECMNSKIKRKKLIAYVRVMDDLINTEEDVQLLRKGNEPVITVNYLGVDKKVADAFNNLLQNFSFHDEDFDHLKEVMDEIQTWYGTHWRHQLTHFIDMFSAAPWILVTMVVAAVILLATLLQTAYTVFGFYQH